MCNPVFVGMAIGATVSAVQGGGLKEIALGAAMGGASAGFGAGAGGAFTAFSSGSGAATGGLFSSVSGSFLADGVGSAIGAGILGGLGGSMFSTPEIPTFSTPQQTAQVQQFNSQNIATTGSGGRQAAASLAESVRRAKQRTLTQNDVDDLSIDTSSFANVGLQLA